MSNKPSAMSANRCRSHFILFIQMISDADASGCPKNIKKLKRELLGVLLISIWLSILRAKESVESFVQSVTPNLTGVLHVFSMHSLTALFC